MKKEAQLLKQLDKFWPQISETELSLQNKLSKVLEGITAPSDEVVTTSNRFKSKSTIEKLFD